MKQTSMSLTLSRRTLLGTAAAFAAAAPMRLLAQDAPAPEPVRPFSYDLLSAEMQAAASTPWVAPAPLGGFLADLGYDDYRLINFRSSNRRWNEPGSPWGVAAFPRGWLFKDPVSLYEVVDGEARPMPIRGEDFEYLNDLGAKLPPMPEDPGIAGFRLHHPLNRPDVMDELVAFTGASYFRALGQDSAYGLSARGIALNTGSAAGEEFPHFSAFYLDRLSVPGAVVVCAAMESPSLTGAYRMVVRPGATTTMDVTARLYFRKDVQELGIAPLTSMFLYSEKNRAVFDDFRPNVHDSDGLRIVRADGEIIWRPLNNPPRLSGSYFPEDDVRAYGLHQRDRKFESYQDTEANYHRRPSLDVEPVGDWGRGHVRLVEIPSEYEANDNIVVYWVPEGQVKAGDAREYSYRLHWGDLPLEYGSPFAHVEETRAGHGGVSGVGLNDGDRKFVIDFRGAMLDRLDSVDGVQPVVTITNGSARSVVLQRVEQNGVWRLIVDVAADRDAVVEIAAHLAGFGRKLTENWLYQWINS